MSAFDTAVHTIQFLSADAVEKAGSGHPGTPMALAGITTELFTSTLRYNPQDPHWPNRDRFVLSCGHASMLLYSVLHLAGYDVSREDLMNFRQWDSKTPGHPEYGHTAGVETTTGPLGQGVGNAVGMALGSQLLAARFNTDQQELFNFRVFAIASDGDLMEGIASEAASIAGQLRLSNLVLIYDDNKITIDGTTEISFSEDVGKRFEAYGWQTTRVDGHNPAEVKKALDATKSATKPSLIIARTHIGIGCPTKQDTPSAHGSALGRDEINAAKKAAGWPLEEFLVPSEATAPFKARVQAVLPEYQAWQKNIAALTGERAALWKALANNEVPADLFAQLAAASDTKTDATRSSGSKVLQKAAELVPQLVSGAADLAGSTKTDLKGSPHIHAGNFAGRNIHFGVREHGMGAIANGLSLCGFVPVTSTFLIFSDYMRPSIRLSAMMKQRAAFVFTHDSIFVGEDGPTHQPIEQTGSLRMIPNLDVFRPADMLECAAAWGHTLSRKDGPTAILLTRQNLPALQRDPSFKNADVLNGAYIVSDATSPEVVLIATGSEVHVACEAKAQLEQAGKRVRVVSAPCLELFKRQPKSLQDAVLGTSGLRVSVEAGSTLTWGSIVGAGLSIGIDHFGASAPAELLAEKFGLVADSVTKRVLQSL
ncbi:MAG: hypothetical protein RJA70_3929 [Pseudomonadota bacterium]|jgi:transketolase